MESLPNTPVEDLKLRETVTNLFALTHFPAAENRLLVSFILLKKVIDMLILISRSSNQFQSLNPESMQNILQTYY